MNLSKYWTLTVIALGISVSVLLGRSSPVAAFSVCGLARPEATFKTTGRLVTICRGEASFQMIMTFYDGTGYQRIPVEREKGLFRGTDGTHNYIINKRELIIGTDGKPPQRERVLQAR
jgi:hypothetical protein